MEKEQRNENDISTIYDRIIKWLEQYNKIPRSNIRRNGVILLKDNMTDEEIEEVSLYKEWYKSKEREILNKYEGIPIKDIPEEYREKIEKLRSYGLGVNTVYEEIIEWLKTHDGKMPRTRIEREGKVLLVNEMTDEERYEKNLHKRWYINTEKNILLQYKESPIEEVPKKYKEKVATLRKYGQMNGNKQAKDKIRESVGKQVENNASTRAELENIIKQVEYDENNASAREKLANIIKQIEPEER